MKEKTKSLFERNSVIIKIAAIGILTLMLLIPMSMIRSLVTERNARQKEAFTDISSKWGGEQRIVGPILTVPYYTYDINKDDERVNETRRFAYFLPENLTIAGEITPEIRYRGIFQVAVYGTSLELKGTFPSPCFDVGYSNLDIDWKGAFLTIGISDLKGITEGIEFLWNGNKMPSEPGVSIENVTRTGVTIRNIIDPDEISEAYNFSIQISLNGSRSLSFVPVGRETVATLKSTWSNPSFDGAFLPTHREVSDSGFIASWRVLELNRNYPQRWLDRPMNIDYSAFGVSLLLPVDTYQITERSMKYAILFFTLTFIVFFFVEILKKLKVHPIQYILVGFALTLFYLLLLSLSEHLGFGIAYLIASIGIVVLITSYTSSVFKNKKLTVLMSALLAILYITLYILLQMQDYTLLLGSIGLFIILSVVMYLSRKVDWYAIGNEN